MVDRRADADGLIQNLGERVDERPCAVGDALLYERGESADEVDPTVSPRLVERLRERERRRRVVPREERRGGRNRDSFVRNRNAVLSADFVADVDEVSSARDDLMIDLFAHLIDVWGRAVVEIERERDGADV